MSNDNRPHNRRLAADIEHEANRTEKKQRMLSTARDFLFEHPGILEFLEWYAADQGAKRDRSVL